MSNVQKHALLIVGLIFFSLIACYKLFHPFFFTSHDGEGHVIRMIEYDEAFNEGQIPVRIAKRINYGLGYPFFNFNYPLPYFIGEMIHKSGFSIVDSFKALFFLSTILGGLSMYVFMVSKVGKIPAFLSSVFYIFVPYRFLNMYVRGNPAESLAWSLLPLLFFTIDRFIKSKGSTYVSFIVLGSIFVLSHNTTVLIGVPIALCYLLIQLTQTKVRNQCVTPLLFSFICIAGITSFFWVPVLAEQGMTKLAELREDYQFFFPTFREVLYSPWGFGAYKQGLFPGKMSPQIGIVHVGIVLFTFFSIMYRIIRKKISLKRDWCILFFFTMILIALFLMLPISKSIWDAIPLLQTVQLPWRFLGVIVFGCSIVAGYVFWEIKISRWPHVIGVFLIIILLLYSNRNHIRVNMYTDFVNPFDRHPTYGFSTTSKDEHMPRLAPRIHEDPDPNGDIVIGMGTSRRAVWKSNYQKFELDMATSSAFRANISYFPGWTATLDNRNIQILYSQDEFQRLRISVPPGKHVVEFRFGEPWYRMLTDIISGMVVMSIIGLIFYKRGKNI
jgi:hypothetical protein